MSSLPPGGTVERRCFYLPFFPRPQKFHPKLGECTLKRIHERSHTNHCHCFLVFSLYFTSHLAVSTPAVPTPFHSLSERGKKKHNLKLPPELTLIWMISAMSLLHNCFFYLKVT
jgi:hypothetical protein